jgi:hypothetical protein
MFMGFSRWGWHEIGEEFAATRALAIRSPSEQAGAHHAPAQTARFSGIA